MPRLGTRLRPTTGSPSLQFVLRDLYIYRDFVWELLDGVIYKTLYENPLDFSKIYDIVMNDETLFHHSLQYHIFLRNRVDFHTKSYKSPDPEVPIQSLNICINRVTQTVSLGCLWPNRIMETIDQSAFLTPGLFLNPLTRRNMVSGVENDLSSANV